MLYDKIEEAVKYVRTISDFVPTYGIVLGTGLGKLADEIQVVASIPYLDIPHFPKTTVKSHEGKLIFGYLAEKKVAALAGRFHFYEGYSMDQVTFPVRVLKYLGISFLFISNAAGSINPAFEPGDLVFIKDHINLQGHNPLRGENDERIGPRFPDLLNTYDRSLNDKVLKLAKSLNIRAHEGVYVGVQGPNLETPAEYNFFHVIGGDVVGMSTVPEVLVAKHMSLPLLVVSIVTNRCYPLDEIKPVTLDSVIEVAQLTEPKVSLLLKEIIRFVS